MLALWELKFARLKTSGSVDISTKGIKNSQSWVVYDLVLTTLQPLFQGILPLRMAFQARSGGMGKHLSQNLEAQSARSEGYPGAGWTFFYLVNSQGSLSKMGESRNLIG